VRVRLPGRAAEHREVHADQRAGRSQDRDHVVSAADDPARRAWDRAPAGCPAGPPRHAGAAPTPDAAGQRLNDLVRSTWSEADIVGVCLPANEKVGPGDRFLVTELARVRRTAKVAVVTKADLVGPDRMAEHLSAIAALGTAVGVDWAEVVPVSARTGEQVELLTDLLVETPRKGRRCSRSASSATSRADAGRRADPRGGARGRTRGAAALHRRGGGGDGHAGRPAGRAAAARHLRQRLRRAAEPEGHRAGSSRCPAQGRRHPGACPDRGAAGHARSSSTCTSRSPRTGSATPSSCASWASRVGLSGV
jgi:hypothetical protein